MSREGADSAMTALLLLPLLLCLVAPPVHGHGRMVNPPGRSNAWRHGFRTPHNYNDMGLNCGGFSNQFETNGGRCGVCGDPWEQKQPRDNELGGLYGVGVIVKSYRPGEKITVDVDITANHRGYFEFRLCPDPQGIATSECLNRHVLQTEQGARWNLPDRRNRVYQVQLQLPAGLTCTRCVLQWLYNAGNNYGNGAQEQFINCADISIGSSRWKVTTSRTTSTRTSRTPSTTRSTAHSTSRRTTRPSSTTKRFSQVTPPRGFTLCRAQHFYRKLEPAGDKWCAGNCRPNYCPQHCVCW